MISCSWLWYLVASCSQRRRGIRLITETRLCRMAARVHVASYSNTYSYITHLHLYIIDGSYECLATTSFQLLNCTSLAQSRVARQLFTPLLLFLFKIFMSVEKRLVQLLYTQVGVTPRSSVLPPA